jgi:hypothetical protein
VLTEELGKVENPMKVENNTVNNEWSETDSLVIAVSDRLSVLAPCCKKTEHR